MRDVESLCEEAGLARTSKSAVATICAELHERFEAFCRRSLYDVNLVVLFLDAIYLPVRPQRPEGGGDLRLGDHQNRQQRACFRAVGGIAAVPQTRTPLEASGDRD